MTAAEFSQEFDILYNNIASNQAPGLTEYEKSVFLTKAQNEIIKNYFTNKPNGNKYQEGIENSAKRYSDFSSIITVFTITDSKTDKAIDPRGHIFTLPNTLMIVLNERFEVWQSEKLISSYQVVPITLQEYQRLMSRPSQDPLKRQVWKLMGNDTSGNGSVEIIPHYKDIKLGEGSININSYKLVVRYIRKPYPIILEDLSSQGLTIDGEKTPYQYDSGTSGVSACELAEELHPEILQRAVELAKVFYTGQPADVINAGQRSE